jgi:hypothetical protein
MNKLEIFLENINYINNSIKTLLGEDNIIAPNPSGSNTVNQKFIVIGDGQTPKENEVNLKDAKKYSTDVEIGDEIDIPVISFENMDDTEIEAELKEMIENGDINWVDIKQMTLSGSSGKVRRTAAGAIKIGPKVLMAAGRLALLGKLKKDIPHSQCYCVKLFDSNKDDTVAPPIPSRSVYESSLTNYIDTVSKEFLDGWDECEKIYKKLLTDETKREKALGACPAIEDFWLTAKETLDKILSSLSKYYNIQGIDIEKKTLAGGSKSVAKSIGENEKIMLHFSKEIKNSTGTVLYNNNSDHTFEIGTYKETGNVVMLTDVSTNIKYFLEFGKITKSQEQTGSIYENDGGKPKSNPTSWKGWIVKYIN